MTSSIDSRGIVNALFANSSITYDQAIKELYHNSDDAKATEFHVHLDKEGDLLIRDDGDGMDTGEMAKFLVLLSEKERGENSHGKFNFGGKQAIMRLCQIGEKNDMSRRAVLISKKRDQKAVCCVFDITTLVNNGWDNSVNVHHTDHESAIGWTNSLMPKLGDFDHGTALFVSPNSQNKSYDGIFANGLMHMARTSFFKRLNSCKFTVSVNGETHTAPFFDPLYFDDAPPEYKKTVSINLWKNGESNVVTFSDGKEELYFRVINKRGHISRTPEKYENGGEKVGTISMVMSNIDYENPFAQYRNDLKQKDFDSSLRKYFDEANDNGNGEGGNEDEEEKETVGEMKKREINERNASFEENRKVLVCRNDLVIGTMPAFVKITRQGRQDGSVMLTCRTRLEYKASSDLGCPLDKIFGVNFNKGRINFDTMSPQMKRTFEGVYGQFTKAQTDHFNSLRPKKAAEPSEDDDVDEIAAPPKAPAKVSKFASTATAPKAPKVSKFASTATAPKAPKVSKFAPTATAPKAPKVSKFASTAKALFTKKTSDPSGKMNESKGSANAKKEKRQEKKKMKEKDVQEKLQKREGGAREVDMDGVRIDLLTDDAIIEVKNYNRRMCAIGQILYYHTQFLNHKPRIHIFDSNGRRDIIFDECCKKYEIAVTYESEEDKDD